MIQWIIPHNEVHAEELGVSPWVIPGSGQVPLPNNQMEEPTTGPVEFKDRVQGHAGWIELLLPYAVSSLILGTITVPSVLHQMPTQRLRLSTTTDQTVERMIVPDLQPPELRVEPTVTEATVSAIADGPSAAIASPAAATSDQPSDSELPRQPPEPPVLAVPQAPILTAQ